MTIVKVDCEVWKISTKPLINLFQKKTICYMSLLGMSYIMKITVKASDVWSPPTLIPSRCLFVLLPVFCLLKSEEVEKMLFEKGGEG